MANNDLTKIVIVENNLTNEQLQKNLTEFYNVYNEAVEKLNEKNTGKYFLKEKELNRLHKESNYKFI